MCEIEERASATKTRPASVSSTRTTRRLSRVNRRNLSCFSISVICLLSADWVRFNLRAALVKCSSSPKAMTACKWRTSTLGNTAPTPAQEFGDTRCFVLPFVCKATSGCQLRTRPLPKSFPRAIKYLNHLHLKPAPDGGSEALRSTYLFRTGALTSAIVSKDKLRDCQAFTVLVSLAQTTIPSQSIEFTRPTWERREIKHLVPSSSTILVPFLDVK